MRLIPIQGINYTIFKNNSEKKPSIDLL